MPDEPQDPKNDERTDQRRAAESLRQQATDNVQGEANAVRYGVYAYTWGPECAQGGQQMTYPTLPPWCPPPQTFPPICPPAAPAVGAAEFFPLKMPGDATPTATFPPICGAPAQAAPQMMVFTPPVVMPTPWTIAGPQCQAAIEPPVGAPQLNITLGGRTCPLIHCTTLVARTCFCPMPTLAVRTCPVQQCGPTMSGRTCPQFICLPTLQDRTCPEWVCPQPGGFRAAADAVGAPAIPLQVGVTILPGHTCPQFVCHPIPTLTGHTCPQFFCFPTLSGHTCPIQHCWPTIFGATCPPIVCLPRW